MRSLKVVLYGELAAKNAFRSDLYTLQDPVYHNALCASYVR